jgi:hypothetical protein
MLLCSDKTSYFTVTDSNDRWQRWLQICHKAVCESLITENKCPYVIVCTLSETVIVV